MNYRMSTMTGLFVYRLIILLSISIVAIIGFEVHRFSYKDCGPNDPIQVRSLDISPDPIVSPGIIDLSVNVSGVNDINSPTKAHVKLQKSIWGLYVDVPCKDIGGCDYPDICAILEKYFPSDQPCPDVFLQNNLPCNCPIPAGNYEINNLHIMLNSTVPKIATGDFHAVATLSQGNDELQCSEIYFSISDSAYGAKKDLN